MEHQVPSQRYESRNDMVEQEVYHEVGVPDILGDERHALPAQLESGPVGELHGEPVTNPVLDRPRMVRVVGAAVGAACEQLAAVRDAVGHVGV